MRATSATPRIGSFDFLTEGRPFGRRACIVASTLSAFVFVTTLTRVGSADDDSDDEAASEPPVALDLALGVWVRRPATRGTITATSDSGARWSVPESSLAPITETMIDFRWREYLDTETPTLFLGIGASGGWIRGAAIEGTSDDAGAPTAFAADGRDGMAMTASILLGTNLVRTKLLEVLTELALGYDVWSFRLSTPPCDSDTGNCSLTHAGFFAEPRLAANLRIARWATVGTWAGYDLWPLGGLSVGAAFTYAPRPGDD